MRLIVTTVLLLTALPASAQRRVDLIIDAEGVRRNEAQFQFQPNTLQYNPEFDDGGGMGLGVNYYFSSRISLELKAAVLTSRLKLRRTGSDFIAIADLGQAQIYPLTALLQWHFVEKGSFRPYIGAGAGYVVLRNIEKAALGAAGIEFEDPTGLVVDGGFLIPLGKRFSLSADARYTPIETQARARFTGTSVISEIDVKPLIVSVGLAYHF